MQTKIEISEEAVTAACQAAQRVADAPLDSSITGAQRRRDIMRAALEAASKITNAVTVPMGEFLSAPGKSVTKALGE